MAAHRLIRVVMVLRKYDSVAHTNNAQTNKSGNIAERAIRVQSAIRVVILQRENDGGAQIDEWYWCREQ